MNEQNHGTCPLTQICEYSGQINLIPEDVQ